jgi:ring-1,2-phenylacetyl-CoA epoxidase subunit PaaE
MLNFFKKTSSSKKSLFTATKKTSRPKFHNLRVEDITRETADCVSVAFGVPDELAADYQFLPGQYLTLEADINGEAVRRSYSLCSSPLDGELRVAIKEVKGGQFSTYANSQLTVGTEMRVMTPDGNFLVNLNESETNNYVGFAAGSGITPIFSIMKSVLEAEPNSSFTLFYGNKTTQSVIFRDKLDGLKNKYMNRLEVHHVLSREDQGSDYLKGRIDGAKCQNFSEQFFNATKVNGYYLCGPEGMINEVSDTLKTLDVPKERIHYELFTSPAQSIAGKTKVKAKKESGEKLKSDVTIILDGDETHFELASNGFLILDAALDAGADVPYACKGAVCCTCRAKVIEGSVEMEMNYALEDDEVEDGYILTCQSHPTSKKVVISFDE